MYFFFFWCKQVLYYYSEPCSFVCFQCDIVYFMPVSAIRRRNERRLWLLLAHRHSLILLTNSIWTGERLEPQMRPLYVYFSLKSYCIFEVGPKYFFFLCNELIFFYIFCNLFKWKYFFICYKSHSVYFRRSPVS